MPIIYTKHTYIFQIYTYMYTIYLAMSTYADTCTVHLNIWGTLKQIYVYIDGKKETVQSWKWNVFWTSTATRHKISWKFSPSQTFYCRSNGMPQSGRFMRLNVTLKKKNDIFFFQLPLPASRSNAVSRLLLWDVGMLKCDMFQSGVVAYWAFRNIFLNIWKN